MTDPSARTEPASTTGAAPRPASDLPRRVVLTGALAVVGGTSLVACGSASSSATSASSAGSSSAGDAGAAGAVIVKLADVPVGSAVSAKLDGKPVIVAQPSKGKVVAFSAICTHQGCTVKAQGSKLNCPCHGSVFDATTGKNLRGPAPSPLASVPVKLDGSGDGVVPA